MIKDNVPLGKICPDYDEDCVERVRQLCPELDEKCIDSLTQMDYYLVGRENYTSEK